jgi:hypothetical protein
MLCFIRESLRLAAVDRACTRKLKVKTTGTHLALARSKTEVRRRCGELIQILIPLFCSGGGIFAFFGCCSLGPLRN